MVNNWFNISNLPEMLIKKSKKTTTVETNFCVTMKKFIFSFIFLLVTSTIARAQEGVAPKQQQQSSCKPLLDYLNKRMGRLVNETLFEGMV